MELIDKQFYWVKWRPGAEWEIARYNKERDRFKCTDGSHIDPRHTEIDYKPIVRS